LALGLFLLVALALGGAFFYLRTSAGERLVFKLVQKALAAKELTLTADSFVGPLPFSLMARNVALADPKGRFLEVKALSVEVKLNKLLYWVAVGEVSLTEPNLLRRPELAAAETEDDSGGGFSLPIGLEATLKLTDGRLAGLALNPERPGAPALVELKGEGRYDSEDLNFTLDGSVLDDAGRGLVIKGALGHEGPEAVESLILNLEFRDQDGQLTFQRPDLPRNLILTVKGQGPLTDWRGNVELRAQDGELRPDPLAPPKASPKADPRLVSTAGLTLAPSALAIAPKIEASQAPAADSPTVLAVDASSAASPDASSAANSAASPAEAQAVPAPNPLTPPSLRTTEEPVGPAPPPGVLAQANIVFKGQTGQLLADLVEAPHFALELSATGLVKTIPEESRPKLPNVRPLPPEASVGLTATVATSDGKEYRGQASLASPLGSLRVAEVAFEPTAAGFLAELTAYLAPGELWDLPAMGFELKAEANAHGEKLEIARLTVSGEGLASEFAAQVDPKSQAAKAKIEAKKDSPLYALLNRLAPQDRWPGDLTVEADLTRDPESGRLTAEGQLALGDLNSLLPAFGGPIAANYAVKGTPGDLSFRLNLAGPKIENQAGPFTDLKLAARGDYRALGETDGLKAEVSLSAVAPAAPLKLEAKVDLGNGPNGLDLSLADFALAAPGIKAQSQGLRLTVAPGQAPRLAGGLTAQVVDWPALGRLAGLNMSGAPAHLEAKLVEGPKPAAEVDLDLPDLKVADFLAVKGLKLKVASLMADQARLTLDLAQGPGRIGPIELKSGAISLDGAGLWSEGLAGSLKAKFLAPHGELLNLEASYSLKDKKAVLKKLVAAPPQLKGSVSLTHEAHLDLADGVQLDRLALALNQGGQIQLAGQAGGSGPLAVKLAAQGLPLNFLDPKTADLPAGQVDLKADYQAGTGGSFDLKTVLNGPPRLTLSAVGALAQNALKGEARLSWPNASEPVKLAFKLPTRPAGDFVALAENSPLEADLAWRGPAAQLWSLTGLEDMALRGQVDIKARSRGTLAQPKPELALFLAKGSLQDPSSGLSLSDLNLSGHINDQAEIKILAEAGDGGHGRLALEGTIDPKASPPNLKARAQLDRLSPLHRDDVTLTLSALATLEGPFQALRLTARALVEKGEASLAQGFGGPAVKTLDLGAKTDAPSSPLTLDLAVEMPNQFYIRGRGLDSEWQGQLRLTGAANKPAIGGYIRPVRGYLELLAKQFIIAQGDIRFHDSTAINPSLNIELNRQTSEILAIIRVSGTKDSPKISLESQPARPADEVLAQILFGKNSSQLSRLETLQLANSLKTLTGIVPKMDLFAPLNAVRDTLGLSVLRFGETASGSADQRIMKGNSFRDNLNLDDDEESSDSAATIEAGKYISDRVYVGLEQDLGKNSTGIRIEVELTPNLNLESKTTTQSSRVGLGWKKDF
jgi:translocation and assembly module TamB